MICGEVVLHRRFSRSQGQHDFERAGRRRVRYADGVAQLGSGIPPERHTPQLAQFEGDTRREASEDGSGVLLQAVIGLLPLWACRPIRIEVEGVRA
jgi:hypothetical protein